MPAMNLVVYKKISQPAPLPNVNAVNPLPHR
jgi:hypothetical protein